MANRWDLGFFLDVPEPRIEFDRLVISYDGSISDATISSGIWIDPITRTAMLAPLPTTAAWVTNFSGLYTRHVKADYTLGTAGDWYDNPRTAAGDIYVEGGENAKATTSASWLANQPFFLSIYIGGVEKLGEQVVFKCGWGTEDAAGTVKLLFRANGTVAVYKAGSPVGVYSLEGGLPRPGEVKSGTKSIARQTLEILLLPCRRRELLVVINNGTGFNHVFTDLDPLVTENTITPAGAFWWQFPTLQASCQLAPVGFETSGVLYGPLVRFRYAPPTGTLFDGIPAYDILGVGVLDPFGDFTVVDASLAEFVADGVEQYGRIKMTLGSSTGTSTYGVYALDAWTNPTLTQTADDPFDITQRIHSLSISVPENGPVTGRLTAFNPAGLIADGLPLADTTGDRPFRLAVGSIDIVRGTTGKPTREYSKGNSTAIADLLTWDLFDREREFREKQFVSALPYDGLVLVDVIEDLMKLGGFPDSDYLGSSDAFVLPYTPAVSTGKFELVPERGDTIAQWLDKLHSTFAATWTRGWVPTSSGYKYQFMQPSDFSSSPLLSLYQSHDDAIAGGVSAALAPYRVIRNLTVERQEAEANQVIVIGQDPGTQALVWAQYDDAASQDPTTVPGSRPGNWRGRTATVQIIDPAITSQEAADRALDIATDRLTVERVIATWESDLLVHSGTDQVLWKADVIRLANVGGSGYVDYRIIAIPQIQMLWESPASTEFDIRECQYIGVRIGSGSGSPAVSEPA